MIPSRLLVVTDRHGSTRSLVETIRAVLDGGARWIWFRDKDLEPAARRDLALELLDPICAAGGWLTIGGDAALAAEIGADGMHLGMGHLDPGPKPAKAFGYSPASPEPSSQGEAEPIRLQPADVAKPASHRFAALPITRQAPRARDETLLVGVSAHSLGDVRRAAKVGVGYVTLSPIFATPSKPGYGPALGLDALREAAAIGPSVIALGGITPEHVTACCEAGAAGVAVMGAVMRVADPGPATRRLLQALHPLT